MPLFTSRTLKKTKASNVWPTVRLSSVRGFREAALVSGDISKLVERPKETDLKDWISYNVTQFFEQTMMLYTSISMSCTEAKCPTMNAGPKFMYYWPSATGRGRPEQLPAREYIIRLFEWVDQVVDNYVVHDEGKPYPRKFDAAVKDIFKRLFRVYAHIYHCHWDQISAAGMEAHLNTCTKHFVLFAMKYNLIAAKQMEPLQEIIKTWV